MRQGFASERVVGPRGVGPATVWCEAGRIVELTPGLAPHPDVRCYGKRVLAPGLVDCHVHMNEPGRSEWEGFYTATRAAAAGGITALVDMPLNSLPVTVSAPALAEKLAASEGQRHVDVGFWGGVVPYNLADLPALAKAGALGAKAFLVHSGIDEFPNVGEAELLRAMPVLRDHGLPLLAHAELDLGAPPSESDPRAYHGYLASRPRAWEDAAIRLLVELCRKTRCPVHIVHLSSMTSIETLRRAKEEGLPISAETCPHYLCFEAEAIPDGATEYKCAPPIRERENREALWQALFEGVIDFVITDHSPCTPALKQKERGHFADAWGGIASLSLGLPAIWSEARARGADLSRLFRWLSAAPAAFAGLSGKKGALSRGHDADLVVWDPEATFAVSPERLHFKHKLSPYLGRSLHGVVHETWLRGELVYDGESPVGGPRGAALLHRAS